MRAFLSKISGLAFSHAEIFDTTYLENYIMKQLLVRANTIVALGLFFTLVAKGQNQTENGLALQGGPVMSSIVIDANVDISDTLWTRRSLLSTELYRKGERLSTSAVNSVFKDTPQAQKLFRTGKQLKPVGPSILVAGLVLGYLGIKGTSETAMIRGVRTTTNPNVPDVEATYTKRNLPKLLGGVGLFFGGLCLIELSNELTRKSVVVYNTRSVSQKSLSHSWTLKMQFMAGGQLGLLAQF